LLEKYLIDELVPIILSYTFWKKVSKKFSKVLKKSKQKV
jgi:hypothetical protein